MTENKYWRKVTNSSDWPEDFTHENGQYRNTCTDCGGLFTGHKRRMMCKDCSTHTRAQRIERSALLLFPLLSWSYRFRHPVKSVQRVIARDVFRREQRKRYTRRDAEAARSLTEMGVPIHVTPKVVSFRLPEPSIGDLYGREPSRFWHPFKHRRWLKRKAQIDADLSAAAKRMADKIDADLADAFLAPERKGVEVGRPFSTLTRADVERTIAEMEKYQLPTPAQIRGERPTFKGIPVSDLLLDDFHFAPRPRHHFRAQDYAHIPLTFDLGIGSSETFPLSIPDDRHNRPAVVEQDRCSVRDRIGETTESPRPGDDGCRDVEQSHNESTQSDCQMGSDVQSD